jgi:hypothetical protein
MLMPSDRNRILELALETLQNKKKQLDMEIAEMTRELRGLPARGAPVQNGIKAKKAPRFTKEERLRRSQRMKAYWENQHKKKAK